jgi:hypothetical protein
MRDQWQLCLRHKQTKLSARRQTVRQVSFYNWGGIHTLMKTFASFFHPDDTQRNK